MPSLCCALGRLGVPWPGGSFAFSSGPLAKALAAGLLVTFSVPRCTGVLVRSVVGAWGVPCRLVVVPFVSLGVSLRLVLSGHHGFSCMRDAFRFVLGYRFRYWYINSTASSKVNSNRTAEDPTIREPDYQSKTRTTDKPETSSDSLSPNRRLVMRPDSKRLSDRTKRMPRCRQSRHSDRYQNAAGLGSVLHSGSVRINAQCAVKFEQE